MTLKPTTTTALRHQDPYTRFGVRVSRLAGSALSAFVIHECGYLPDGLHIRIENGQRRADWRFPGVRSPYWRLYYNHNGGSFVRCLGRETPLDPGHVVIIAEDILFDCVGDAGFSHLWLHFSPLHHPPPPFDEPVAVPLTTGLSAALDDLVAAHGVRGSEISMQRLYHSASALVHATFAVLPLPTARAYPDRLATVIAQIDANPASDLANQRLARAAAMSVETFIRWFRRHLGTTPAAYVTRSRVRAAARLLVLSDHSVDTIAAETGFPNRYYLSRVFATHMGCGPATFRRRHVGV